MTNKPTAPDLRSRLAALTERAKRIESRSAEVRVDDLDAILALLPIPIPQGEDGFLDELEAAAKKATPGSWQRSGVRQKLNDADCIMVGPDAFLIAAVPIGRPNDHAGAFCDAGFIALANPEAVLRLIAIARAAGGKQ